MNISPPNFSGNLKAYKSKSYWPISTKFNEYKVFDSGQVPCKFEKKNYK